ncbi:SnoaL-like domain protein [Marine Group I thaumarchaeote SCGC AAA799-O18]|nr:SnoaL-like domain protein [Marine Group I thaumarchaeote SCGC AAA799-O18]
MTEKEVIKVIESFFDVGKTKNFSVLREIQMNDSMFSSFSDVPPYNLKNYSDTITLEELRFSSISDYEYKIIDPIISIYGNIAIIKFRLMQKGMLVDNKAFTGTHITINGRATFVLIKEDSWKIIHYHLDKIFE